MVSPLEQAAADAAARATGAGAGAGRPRYRDYREEAAKYGLGRGVFRRLRAAGAFDEGSALRAYNPFLAEGQSNWESNPLARFSGPGRQKPNLSNVLAAINDILAQEKVANQAGYDKVGGVIESGMGVLGATGDAVKKALGTDVIPPAQLAQMQAAARERIAREGGMRRGALSAQLAGQGMKVDDLNAAYAAQEGQTLYQAGQSDITQATEAMKTNRQGLIDAIASSGVYTGNLSETVKNLLANEEFRKSLTEDQINALMGIAGLRQASLQE